MVVDLARCRVLDLSQDWDIHTPGFALYEGPTVKWIKRVAFERAGGQWISSTLHVGTHLDAPLHFITGGEDIASIPLSKLVGWACIVDLTRYGIGDYDIYGPEHFEQWEQDTGITIQPGDILVIHTGITITTRVTGPLTLRSGNQTRHDISSNIRAQRVLLQSGCSSARSLGWLLTVHRQIIRSTQ